MKTHVIVFPGSNCDRDVAVAIKNISGQQPQMVWHKETSIEKSDLICGFDFIGEINCDGYTLLEFTLNNLDVLSAILLEKKEPMKRF